MTEPGTGAADAAGPGGLADGIVDLYARRAADYIADRAVTPWVEGAWLTRFADALPRHARVLDLGCGAGAPMAAWLIGHGVAVTGIDAAPDLVAHARDRFPDQNWQVADMRGLDLGLRFDGVLAWDSFFHLGHDDQRAMFAVFARHAAPGAMLMFTSGPAHGEAIGSWHGEPLYHASLAPEAYRALLAAHGFALAHHVAEDPACGGHTVWLARRTAD